LVPPLVAAAAFQLGGALAKAVFKLWLRDSTVGAAASSSLVDLIQARVTSYTEQRRTMRQFEQLAEEVAERLTPLIEHEYRGLPENERVATVIAVADTFDQASFEDSFFLAFDLDPVRLEEHLLAQATAQGPSPDALLNEAGRHLYGTLLREACNYAVEIVVTLPEFTNAALTEILQRETTLLELVRRVLSQLPVASSTGLTIEADATFETQYRREVARKLDRLELFGLNVPELSRRYALSVAYITLSSITASNVGAKTAHDLHASGEDGDDDSRPPGEDTAGLVRIDDALAGSPRSVIRGEAGSGKTTLLQWLACATVRSRPAARFETTSWTWPPPSMKSRSPGRSRAKRTGRPAASWSQLERGIFQPIERYTAYTSPEQSKPVAGDAPPQL
jgi:hypothetical protein